MIPFLMSLLVMVIIVGLIYWIVSIIPFPPPLAPLKTVILVIVGIICLFYLIGMLVGYAPPFPVFHQYRY